jgi:hypothetical protein
MGWDDARRIKESGGAEFIKLKDGETVRGVFRGEPYIFYQEFGDKSEYDDYAEGRSTRFKINFVVKEGERYVAKIFGGGYYVLTALVDYKDKHGLDVVYEVKRNGTGTDTRYTIMYDNKLTDSQLDKVKEVKLKELRRGRTRTDGPDELNPPPLTDADAPPDEEDIPF